jgi:hypothetical protein
LVAHFDQSVGYSRRFTQMFHLIILATVIITSFAQTNITEVQSCTNDSGCVASMFCLPTSGICVQRAEGYSPCTYDNECLIMFYCTSFNATTSGKQCRPANERDAEMAASKATMILIVTVLVVVLLVLCCLGALVAFLCKGACCFGAAATACCLCC